MPLLPKSRWGRIRFALIIIVGGALLTWRLLLPGIAWLRYEPQEGDVIFQSLPHFDLVDCIEGVTGSPYSHCGMVVQQDGKWMVNEALDQVGSTPLLAWILRGRNGFFAIGRIEHAYRNNVPAVIQALEPFQGRPYDMRYRMDDEAIYCSELIYKAYRNAMGLKLGKLHALGEMNWNPWKGVIEKYECGPVPLKRLMITPQALSEAKALRPVFSYGF